MIFFMSDLKFCILIHVNKTTVRKLSNFQEEKNNNVKKCGLIQSNPTASNVFSCSLINTNLQLENLNFFCLHESRLNHEAMTYFIGLKIILTAVSMSCVSKSKSNTMLILRLKYISTIMGLYLNYVMLLGEVGGWNGYVLRKLFRGHHCVRFSGGRGKKQKKCVKELKTSGQKGDIA